jgi:hypothetical protein
MRPTLTARGGGPGEFPLKHRVHDQQAAQEADDRGLAQFARVRRLEIRQPLQPIMPAGGPGSLPAT